MEDLVPLVFFLIIVAVNVLKFVIEKAGKAKNPAGQPQESPPKRASSLESFFEDLAQQMAPKPTELAEWPEGRERPDYAQEMEELQQEQTEEPVEYEQQPAAELIPMPVPKSQAAKVHSKHSNRSGLRLKGGKALRQAMLAHIIFSPPRALDLSFDDTISSTDSL